MAWEEYVLIAAFCSVMVSAMLIMLSRLFDFKPLEQSAKAEIVFAASSVAIALLLVGTMGYVVEKGKIVASEMYAYTYNNAGYQHYADASGNEQVLTPDTLKSPMYSPTEIVALYMRSVMYCAESIGRTAFFISMAAHWASSTSQDVFMAYPTSGWAWSGVAQSADNMLNAVYFTEVIYRLQIYVMRFIDAVALPLFLPIGIFLRSFPPTRGAGAYIIALSLGFYFVYPMAYLAAAFSSPYPNICVTPQIPMPNIGGNSKAGIYWELAMWVKAFEGDVMDFFGKLSDLTNALMMNLCFFPFLAFAITLSFVQGSNALFGANLPEIGRGIIRLI